MDLSEVLLLLAALGIGDPARFSWFEAPDAAALAAGATLLRRLGAVDGKGELTQIGRQMLRFPTHPRLARLLVEGENRGVGEESAVLAAILSEGDISDTARANLGPGRMALPGAEGADLLERVDRFFQARALRFDPARLRGLGVDARAADSVEKARRQLAGVFQKGGRAIARPTDREAVDVALAKATLMAFPDRVMQRRSPGASEAVLATGGAVEIGPLPPGDLLVAVDAEERAGAPGRKTGRAMCVRLAVAVEPEWLLDMLPEGLSETTEANWNETTLRVETVSRLAYGSVVLAETKRAAHPSADASRMLAQVVLDDRGQNQVMSDSSVIELKVKLYVLRKAFPEHDIPDLEAQDIRTIVTAACDGLTSMQELRAMPLGERLRATLTPTVERMLRSDTPDRVVLASGHQISVHYEEGKSPWIESRLQDFFGMKAGPTLCRARVPLTLHLLAPNLRAVQVTSDLAGFWHRHYPEIRRELCRRYPKHAWPEDGATATPPAPRPRQR
jgi:ATP-dependent helicase HrpB